MALRRVGECNRCGKCYRDFPVEPDDIANIPDCGFSFVEVD